MTARSLEGRVAMLQAALAGMSLLALAGLSLAALTFLLRREQDARLDTIAAQTVEALQREVSEGGSVDEWLNEDLRELCPPGVQIQVFAGARGRVAITGIGPGLAPPQSVGCGELAEPGWRGCSREMGAYRVVATRSEAADAEVKRLMVLSIATVGLLLGALMVILSRTVARRALAPLTRITTAVSQIEPATGARIDEKSGLQEVDRLALRFNDLLSRVDETLCRERRFAAEASHELKTPLTVIRGEIENLRGYGGEVGAASARALHSVDGLIRIVEALLMLSRAQIVFNPASLAAVNVCDLVREQSARLTSTPPYSGRHVEVELPDEVLIAADERLIGIALSNLLENALKYSAPETHVRVSMREAADRVAIVIEDRGPGVPAELQQIIFEPFSRGSNVVVNTPGEGLGLALARAVARAHGGDVVLANTSATGSRFDLALPPLGRSA